MKALLNALALSVAMAGMSVPAWSKAPVAPNADIAAAIADPARPDTDRARDADRLPAEMIAFAGIRPGMNVVDLMPGGGYFTRIFSDVVGPTGTVTAYLPDEMMKNPKSLERLTGIATGRTNVKPVHDPLMNPGPKAFADVVWTSQNYHDLHNLPGVDMVAFNKLIFDAIKPGGVYIVLDHAAAAGSGARDTKTLHRIDPALVKSEVTQAGFVFAGASKVLANRKDDHRLPVFDPSLRGHTDQFVYRFRKPKA